MPEPAWTHPVTGEEFAELTDRERTMLDVIESLDRAVDHLENRGVEREHQLRIFEESGHPVPTIDCVTTCEDGEVGFVPLRRDTVSSAEAMAMMFIAAERWSSPLCRACQKPPRLYAGREHPENEERVIVLDHDDPAVEFRQWIFDVLEHRDVCGCPPAATPEGGEDA